MGHYYYIHCFDCGEHSWIGPNRNCPCSSIEYKGCDAMAEGECEECDRIYEEENPK